jgi:hypothetical protein
MQQIFINPYDNEQIEPEFDNQPDDYLSDEELEILQEESTAGSEKWYVNPDTMLSEYIIFKNKNDEHLTKGGEQNLEIPRYLADCIIKIANHLSYRYNFIGYSFRDEMIADGIFACTRGFFSFSPEISPYIFSYFTRACFYAAVARIKKEGDQTKIKGKIINNLDVENIISQEQDNGEHCAELIEYMKISRDFKMRPEKPKLVRIIPRSENQPDEIIFE